jgi:hypothetical protein
MPFNRYYQGDEMSDEICSERDPWGDLCMSMERGRNIKTSFKEINMI